MGGWFFFFECSRNASFFLKYQDTKGEVQVDLFGFAQ